MLSGCVMRGTGRLKSFSGSVSRFAACFLLFAIWLLDAKYFLGVMSRRALSLLHGAATANTDPCHSPDCDFSIIWPAGALARIGDFQRLYEPAFFLAWRHAFLFAGAQRLDWIYPPPSLLPAAVISLLPFQAAFFTWIVGLAAAAAFILRWAGLSWRVIAGGLLSPAALYAYEMGQFDVFCGACAVAGLLMTERAPWRAGALLGILIFKPQAGLLAPLAPLLRRNLPAVAGGLAAAALLTAVPSFWFGRAAWHAYFLYGRAASDQIVGAATPIGANGGLSILWMLRVLGASLSDAYAAQGSATVLAILLVWRIWAMPGFSWLEQMALTVFVSLLAVPYGFVDDMVAYSIALAALAEARDWDINFIDALLFLWPVLCPIVYGRFGVLLTPVAVGLAVVHLLARNALDRRDLSPPLAVLPRSG